MTQKKSIALSLLLLVNAPCFGMQLETASPKLKLERNSGLNNINFKSSHKSSLNEAQTIQLSPSIQASKNVEILYAHYDSIHSNDSAMAKKLYDNFIEYSSYFLNEKYYSILNDAGLLDSLRLNNKRKTFNISNKNITNICEKQTGLMIRIFGNTQETINDIYCIATINIEKEKNRISVEYSFGKDITLLKIKDTELGTFPTALDQGQLFKDQNNILSKYLDVFNKKDISNIAYVNDFVQNMQEDLGLPVVIRCTGSRTGAARATLLWMSMISFYGKYRYTLPEHSNITKNPVYVTLETYNSPRVVSLALGKAINKAKNNIFRFAQGDIIDTSVNNNIPKTIDNTKPMSPMESGNLSHIGDEITLMLQNKPNYLLPITDPERISASIDAVKDIQQSLIRGIYDAKTVADLIQSS